VLPRMSMVAGMLLSTTDLCVVGAGVGFLREESASAVEPRFVSPDHTATPCWATR